MEFITPTWKLKNYWKRSATNYKVIKLLWNMHQVTDPIEINPSFGFDVPVTSFLAGPIGTLSVEVQMGHKGQIPANGSDSKTTHPQKVQNRPTLTASSSLAQPCRSLALEYKLEPSFVYKTPLNLIRYLVQLLRYSPKYLTLPSANGSKSSTHVHMGPSS